jgi:hypothetical protein
MVLSGGKRVSNMKSTMNANQGGGNKKAGLNLMITRMANGRHFNHKYTQSLATWNLNLHPNTCQSRNVGVRPMACPARFNCNGVTR